MNRSLGLTLALFLVPGCYCSHERDPDAGLRVDAPDAGSLVDAPDAAPSPDVSVDGGPLGAIHWIPIDLVDVEVLWERCEVREGQTPIFRVRVTANSCDEPGNIAWRVDHAAHTIELDPFIWRPVGGPACPPSTTLIERDVALTGTSLAEGAWTVSVVGSTARAAFTVASPPPELTCTDCRAPGEACAIDLECAGPSTCVPLRGDAICNAVCGLPCQPFPEAAAGGTSSDLGCTALLGLAATCTDDPNYGWLCEEATLDLCGPCPAGTRCSDAGATSFCSWDISPWDAGSSCISDADCRPGISCVELDGTRTCAVRCRSDHPCPSPARACGEGELVCEIPKV